MYNLHVRMLIPSSKHKFDQVLDCSVMDLLLVPLTHCRFVPTCISDHDQDPHPNYGLARPNNQASDESGKRWSNGDYN